MTRILHFKVYRSPLWISIEQSVMISGIVYVYVLNYAVCVS